MDLTFVLRGLALRRPIFHSEKDFQFALGEEIRSRYPAAVIRFEYPRRLIADGEKGHFDLIIWENGSLHLVELKYRTRAFGCMWGEKERFILEDHGADDNGCYDFILDVQRLERAVAVSRSTMGHAIFLTNSSKYQRRRRRGTNAEQFALHEGHNLHGHMEWSSRASAGARDGREDALDIAGIYPCAWQTFSKVGEEFFWMLKVSVKSVRAQGTTG